VFQMVNSEMVVLARESRGLTQKELAEKLAITQGFVSKVESGYLGVSPEMLSDLVRVLHYPANFFSQTFPIFPAESHFYRKNKTLTAKVQAEILAKMNIFRKQVKELLDDAEIEFRPLPEFDLDEYGTPEKVAQATRHFLRLPRGPIKNIIKILEDAGVLIIGLDVRTRMFSGAGMHAENPNYIIFVNKDMPADRLRFTLAHELGHIIMHRIVRPMMELEADLFASEFLMPAREVAQYLSNVTLERLASLKKFWKVSMAAILKHALNLGKITQRQYQYIWTQMGMAGYRLKEPPELDAPQEKPTLLSELIELHLEELGYSVEQLSDRLALFADEFVSIYLSPKSHLRLVQQTS
jgi:Zn-dependent peptidase ImmA (M78 family)